MARPMLSGSRIFSTPATAEMRLQARPQPSGFISLANFDPSGRSVPAGFRSQLSDSTIRQNGEQPFALTSLSAVLEETTRWDVLGLGQAMVDFAATVDDAFLAQLGVEKGGRKLISIGERAHILELLDGNSYQISAGGSLANTLANLARLGQADQAFSHGSAQPLRVAAASVAGCDALGAFHTAQQSTAGVATISSPLPESGTGTVVVLTTPDANRTFLSYLGSSQEMELPPEVMTAIRSSRLVAIEGYLWEMPQATDAIRKVVELAQASGTVVALTAGDAHVVQRHRNEIWDVLHKGIDILFANRSEAEALLQQQCTAESAALQLGPYCSMVVVTDGVNGSCISAMGRLQVVPPYWASTKPVDTCGAGDAYAAGMLYGWLLGMDPSSMGRCGARVASAVIGKSGNALSLSNAAELVEVFSSWRSAPLDFTSTARNSIT